MPHTPDKRSDKNGDLILDVQVIPNAAKTQVDGLYEDGTRLALKIRLHAPPVDGKANEALLKWLAAQLGIPRKSIELIRGKTSKRKQLKLSAETAAKADWDKLAPAQQSHIRPAIDS
ncbi:MAG: DUF167 domain-containing protein [Pseudomonadota bacterium]